MEEERLAHGEWGKGRDGASRGRTRRNRLRERMGGWTKLSVSGHSGLSAI